MTLKGVLVQPSTLSTATDGYDVVLIPRQRTGQPPPSTPEHIGRRRWYSMREVADMLGYGLSKVKMLVITGELKSIKDGKYRRILPEWIDDYVIRKATGSDD